VLWRGARPDNLNDLMGGLLEANERMRDDGVAPVLTAAATAFGFIYVYPFLDGNDRMYRCLIHHVSPNGSLRRRGRGQVDFP